MLYKKTEYIIMNLGLYVNIIFLLKHKKNMLKKIWAALNVYF